MRVAQINMTPHGSTGKIMRQITRTAREAGIEANAYAAELFNINGKWPHVEEEHLYYFGYFYENMLHNYLGKALGRNGHFSFFGTRQLIKMLKKFAPDIVHIHNIHAQCVHLPSLFKYLRKSGVKVIWTLHDCWSFTGHCPHFDLIGCEKWKTGCHHCPQLRGYPKSYLDTTKSMYKKKKDWFTAISNMVLVTPSHWLAGLVKQSFLKDCPIQVINNGIDLTVFSPTENNFREKHGIPAEKKILLGVSFGWGYKKGLDVFLELAERLDPARYQIVLVGTNESTDAQLPPNIISIHRTNDQKELAEIYTAADLLVNPTKEDTFPTVNIEALACGTPVLTFRTGGSPEILTEACGSVVDCNDVDAMEKEIVRICTESPFTSESCRQHAENFDMYARFSDYIALYKEVVKE